MGNTTNVDAKRRNKDNKPKDKTKGEGKRGITLSKVRQSMTKQNMVNAVGAGLQGLGGQWLVLETKVKMPRDDGWCWRTHAVGGLTGTQRFTTRNCSRPNH